MKKEKASFWILLVASILLVSSVLFAQEPDVFSLISRYVLKNGVVSGDDAEKFTLTYQKGDFGLSRIYHRKDDIIIILVLDLQEKIVIAYLSTGVYKLFSGENYSELAKSNGKRIDSEMANYLAAQILMKYLPLGLPEN